MRTTCRRLERRAEMPDTNRVQSLKRVVESPVYWFSRFETATLKQNHDEARKAKQHLEHLGFIVFSPAGSRVKGGE
jgi:hypothetical protein